MSIEPIALCKQGTDEVIAYACGKCRIVAGSPITHGDDALHVARNHCGPWTCEQCSAVHDDRFQMMCQTCRTAKSVVDWAAKKDARREKATRVSETDYSAAVFWDDGMGDDEGYFRDTDALREWCDDEEMTVPLDVWACSITSPYLNPNHVIEMAREDQLDNAGNMGTSNVLLVEEADLRAFINQWNAKQTYESWMVDYSRLVVLKS